MSLFIRALIAVAKMCNQPRCHQQNRECSINAQGETIRHPERAKAYHWEKM